MSQGKRESGYSKWFRMLNHLIGPVITIGIISGIIIIISDNAYAYVVDVIVSVFTFIWLSTFIVESVIKIFGKK
ncbi:hypothetical protein [Lentilactobacillus buchneri]|uniref:Uncharacterized protein n=1 Tax=Lentilactobacillus buchneri subsp. silagei CD034 TaxID=1071400 RepID=J9W0Q5_LENBU|nr:MULTISPECIES: hypothetical protein [Lentilactobacillus]MCC6100791.1 hypothetical protein [Lactobacillus sp.]AFR99301.1 hypothetical protein LBUCD034_0193 [Lentilactobacillus buchneri subsp. silagei CD034]MCT2900735.1 hypothetical protein [Lentilactobacillus buchneri]MCT3541429.1 hypothetical protein [Lentilactobacillus buchneri]MCT3546002.1 hypothetical protein [Lentilactobacillus buchneri]